MKKFGLFLLKNNIHLMTLVFLGWAVWAAFNWSGLALVQKLTLGMYALLIIHEYEEGYKGRFLDLMAGRLLQIDWRTLIPGVTHIAQALYITLAFSAALIWPEKLWLTFAVIILCIFEGFVHNMGIMIFRLRSVTPGWWTAMLMCAYAIWSIVVINSNIEYDRIQWLWGVLCFLGCFLCMEILFQSMLDKPMAERIASVKRFMKERFGKTGSE